MTTKKKVSPKIKEKARARVRGAAAVCVEPEVAIAEPVKGLDAHLVRDTLRKSGYRQFWQVESKGPRAGFFVSGLVGKHGHIVLVEHYDEDHAAVDGVELFVPLAQATASGETISGLREIVG